MTPASEIKGDRTLPAGFGHPHASDEARAVAEAGMVLRVQVGSGVHGTSISGHDDRDEVVIYLEPPELVTGMASVPRGINASAGEVDFEQLQRHTVWDKPGGLANRSGAGDLDVVIYSARFGVERAEQIIGHDTMTLAMGRICPVPPIAELETRCR